MYICMYVCVYVCMCVQGQMSKTCVACMTSHQKQVVLGAASLKRRRSKTNITSQPNLDLGVSLSYRPE